MGGHKRNNEKLRKIFRDDQRDRLTFDANPERVTERDKLRRIILSELMATGKLRTGVDYYRAAVIFQHGLTTEDYQNAYRFAKAAVQMGNVKNAAWLYAITLDRLLVSQGHKQRFGTQFQTKKSSANSRKWIVRLLPVDRRTSDRARAAHNIPSLRQLLALQKTYTDQLHRPKPKHVQ